MPTGYTEIIERETEPTFAEYLWRCTRAFGCCVHLRDEPMDLKLTPEVLTRQDRVSYYLTNAAKAQEAWDEWCSMSVADQLDWAAKDKEKAIKAYAEELERSRVMWARYQRMRQQVQSWKPPTPEHDGLKEFMISQIDASLKYLQDPNDPDAYLNKAARELAEKSLEDLVQEHTMKLLGECSYYLEEVAKMERLQKNGSKWIQALMESVPLPE